MLNKLNIKIFSDGANLAEMIQMSKLDYIQGLTTNPTLMRKSGIVNYEKFAKEVLNVISTKPISFEVFSDEISEMKEQATKIAGWGENVYVKIPVSNTKGEKTLKLVNELGKEGIKVNVTAVMTSEQVEEINSQLSLKVPSYISIFAGRIADTGQNPLPIVSQSLKIVSDNKSAEVIWASPRELLNIFQANEVGCHVITATNDILKKLSLVGKDLNQYSLETVEMFHKDAIEAGFQI